LRKIIKPAGRILSPGRDVNSAPSVYKAGLIATRQSHSVIIIIIIIIIIISCPSLLEMCDKPK